MLRAMLRLPRPSPLRAFVRQCLHQQRDIAPAPNTERTLWPMPPPFPEVFGYAEVGALPAASGYSRAFKLMLNLVVIVFGWLAVGRPAVCPRTASAGTRPTAQQRDTIANLLPAVKCFTDLGAVEVSQLGRASEKVLGLTALLDELEAQALMLSRKLAPYGLSRACREREPVVLDCVDSLIAKPLVASRLAFSGTPGFDPRPLYDEATRAAYEDPAVLAVEPGRNELPLARVRGERAEVLATFAKLDAGDRLALVCSSDVFGRPASGMFAVTKDLMRDRLILDSRPVNQVERALLKWTRTMATASAIVRLVVPLDKYLYLSSDDLVDYYYQFRVTHKRALRNVLRGSWGARCFENFRCYDETFSGRGPLSVCLSTMAMGDHNAVEFGQAAHMTLGYLSGAILPHESLHLDSLPPRSGWRYAAGIIQDDHASLEVVDPSVLNPDGSLPADSSISEVRFNRLNDAYERVGLVTHPSKRHRRVSKAVLWGGEIDGVLGTVRAPAAKTLALADVTVRTAELGYSTVSLLQTLAGSWVSVFMYRRRWLCTLSEIFRETHDRDPREVIRLPMALRAELLTIAAVSLHAYTDLKSQVSSRVYTTDASNTVLAFSRTFWDPEVAREIYRHMPLKGGWNRLLKPADAWRHEHGLLEPELSVPGPALPELPAATALVRSSKFEVCKVWRYARQTHINVGELRAAVGAEIHHASVECRSRFLVFGDSMVSTCACLKGRSSSPALNRVLLKSLPYHAGSVLFPCYGWLRSADNPCDDPTRFRDIREPCLPSPSWASDISAGSFASFDAYLSGVQNHPVGRPSLSDVVPVVSGGEVNLTRQYRKWMKGVPPSACTIWQGGLAEYRPSAWGPAPLSVFGCPAEAERECLSRAQTSARLNGAGLCEEAVSLLASFPRCQFLVPPPANRLDAWLPVEPGVLDLFAGSRRSSKAALVHGFAWVLTFDLAHGPEQDLLDRNLQARLFRLIQLGAFVLVCGGPPCSSLSVAVTPPIRTKLYPRGVPWAPTKMKHKILIGNALASFTAKCAWLAHPAVLFWVENPRSSWLWKLRPFLRLSQKPGVGFWRVDYCRYGTLWKKPTSVLTNIDQLVGRSTLCSCPGPHLNLRGNSPWRTAWSKVAEPYPHGFAESLAIAGAVSCGRLARRVDLDAIAQSAARRAHRHATATSCSESGRRRPT